MSSYGRINFLVLVIFCLNLIINCVASDVFDRYPWSPQHNEGFVCRPRQERSVPNNKTVVVTNTSEKPRKKWQVGRVSRKQYEIINMLWRKTKVFMDVESSTISKLKNRNDGIKKNERERETNRYFGRKATVGALSVPQSSTPSFIEFYYFDENENQGTLKNDILNKIGSYISDQDKIKAKTFAKNKTLLRQSPFLSFHVHQSSKLDTANLKQNIKPQYNKQSRAQKFINAPHTQPHKNYSNFRQVFILNDNIKLTDLVINNTLFGKKLVTVKVYLNGSLVSTTKQPKKYVPKVTRSSVLTTFSTSTTESTPVYDKIRFFERYDSYTLDPLHNQSIIDDGESNVSDQVGDKKHEKIDLENVNQNIGHHDNRNKVRYEKKHVNPSYSTGAKALYKVTKKPSQSMKANNTVALRDKSSLESLLKQTLMSRVANVSKLTAWSNYPFVAVYVYEPTQTHCDAAGISPHWLIAAGSCLSHHHLVQSEEARSAFVTYCGESWRRPERIAYVKKSVIHPKFHPKDKAKRYLYNIGLIQVSSSMASSCHRWSPVSLMSHQFDMDPGGSMAAAVGWGLDRYGTGYMSGNLPPWPLTVYEGLVYSDSCPGSITYSKAKHQGEDSGANNVFCLLLPPYSGEETDPVHGGLLVAGGKLIALYLQEERRSYGLQSAQYTAVWRLVPWVLDVAREPEVFDMFSSMG